MKVALICNTKMANQSGASADDTFEEYDSPETIAAVAGALAGLRVDVEPVEADKRLPWRLEQGRYDFAFNMAEGRGRRCREAIPAAVCELLDLPFTGSDAVTLGVTLDKFLARRVVSPDVPVARAVLLEYDAKERMFLELSYPVLVKPNDEGSSKGITENSIAWNAGEAYAIGDMLRHRYECPVLAEEFLPGMEVTVAVTGNGRDARVLGMMEIAPVDSTRGFALTAFRLLGCRDIARLDFRFDANGVPRFLECNPLPGLNPDSGDVVILARDILPYDALVQGILVDAGRRYGVSI
jgi:D-alanine-D-alanine ligase